MILAIENRSPPEKMEEQGDGIGDVDNAIPVSISPDERRTAFDPSAERMDGSLVGADKEPSSRNRKAVGAPLYRGGPEGLPGRAVEGGDLIPPAGEERSSGANQLVGVAHLPAPDHPPGAAVQGCQEIISEEIGYRRGDNHGVAALKNSDAVAAAGVELLQARSLPGAWTVDEGIAGQQREGTHDISPKTSLQASRRATEDIGRASSRREVEIAGGQKSVALQGYVIPAQSAPVIGTAIGAGERVNRANIDSLPGKNAGAEIGRVAADENTAANRPDRYITPVAGHQAGLLRARGRVAPPKRAVALAKTVDRPILGAEIHVFTLERRREAHRTIGGKGPLLPSIGRVQPVDRIIDR